MTLYDQAVELQLKLESTQAVDSAQELVNKAGNFADAVEDATSYLDGVVRFRTRLSIAEAPPIDRSGVAAALKSFRTGLSTYRSRAFQQQSAAKLVQVAKEQRAQSSRWVTARWKALFQPSIALINAVEEGRLVGGSPHRRTAERVGRTMSMLMRQNPVSDESKLVTELCGGDPDLSWPDQIASLADELSRAFRAMEGEREALTPDVRSALQAAASPDGFSLEDMTSDVLEKLRAAGMAGDLVVRRR